jgi:hypothetical protein
VPAFDLEARRPAAPRLGFDLTSTPATNSKLLRVPAPAVEFLFLREPNLAWQPEPLPLAPAGAELLPPWRELHPVAAFEVSLPLRSVPGLDDLG